MFSYNFFFYHCICKCLSSLTCQFFTDPHFISTPQVIHAFCSKTFRLYPTLPQHQCHCGCCYASCLGLALELPGMCVRGEHSWLGCRAQLPSALLDAAHYSPTHAPAKRSLKCSHCSMSSLVVTKLPKFCPSEV